MKYTAVLLFLSSALFETLPASAAIGDELAKLTASDGAAGDLLGATVGISGITAIVGAIEDDDDGDASGSAYLFDITTGSQLAKLTPSDGAAYHAFGVSVGIGGKTAIVGAIGDNVNGFRSGSAYLYDITTGTQLVKLTPSDGAEHDWFGTAVAISGNMAIVGAHGDDNASGSSYLFDITTGAQLAKLTPSDGAAEDQFGTAVGISSNMAIVGAHLDDDNGNASGSAYLFDITTGSQLAKLTPSDGAAGDRFGTAVGISGNLAIVGAHGDDMVSGSAYLFDITTGTQLAKLTPNDRAEGDFFSKSVGISGNLAIVGAYQDDDNGNSSGSAYLFDITTGAQLAKLTPSDGAHGDFFGWSVGIGGNTAIVGAITDADNGVDSGSAYLFDATIPEPSTLLMGVLVSVGVLGWRRR